MDQIHLEAYAKINLTLDIVGRREDGYHLLSSVMQSVSLADTLILTKQPRGITITSDNLDLPTDERNICWSAAQAFYDFTQLTGGVEIVIKKRIPLAAGIGGGSADAAAVLQGLNRLYGANLKLEQLQELGLTVGADVPFCLQGGTCLVEGIGEKVSKLPAFPKATLVLVKPKCSVFTAQVFRELKPKFYGRKSTQVLTELLEKQQELPKLATVLENTLESVTKDLVPEVDFWKRRLLDHGALGALMSGSGPTVFGVFPQEAQAQQFLAKFQDQAQVFVVETKATGVWEMNGGDR